MSITRTAGFNLAVFNRPSDRRYIGGNSQAPVSNRDNTQFAGQLKETPVLEIFLLLLI